MDIFEKSHQILKEIIKAQDKFNFKIILVGGWGVYCYNPYMKSKDIDLLVKEQDVWKLRNFLNSIGFRETGKVLEKKGFAMLVGDDKIEIDVYDKKIGNIDVMEIFNKNLFSLKEFNGLKVHVANLELLLALKVISGYDRIGTGKGMKDISDILAILDKHSQKINFGLVCFYATKAKVKKVFSVIFSDYRKIRNLYSIGFTKFEKIKKSLAKIY